MIDFIFHRRKKNQTKRLDRKLRSKRGSEENLLIDQRNESTKFSWQTAAWQRTHRDQGYCHSFVLYSINWATEKHSRFWYAPVQHCCSHTTEIQFPLIHSKQHYLVQIQAQVLKFLGAKNVSNDCCICNWRIVVKAQCSVTEGGSKERRVTRFSLNSLTQLAVISHFKIKIKG